MDALRLLPWYRISADLDLACPPPSSGYAALSAIATEREMAQCTHRDQIKGVKPNAKGCEECLRMGDRWVHLRMCLACGHVGCCDDSKNKHATKHFQQTQHPIMTSFEPGEDWSWCYVDGIPLSLP